MAALHEYVQLALDPKTRPQNEMEIKMYCNNVNEQLRAFISQLNQPVCSLSFSTTRRD